MLKCKKGYELKVLNGNLAGFYIGTLCEDGFPNCRLSEGYFKTRDAGEQTLQSGIFVDRRCPENYFCSGNGDCGITD